MSNQYIGATLESGEALNLGLMGISGPLRERVGRIFGSAVLWLDVMSAQNIQAEDGRDRYIALGIILRTEELADSPPANRYLRIDGGNERGLSPEQLTAVGDCALRRPLRYCHPDGQVLAAPQPIEAAVDGIIPEPGITAAPNLTLVTGTIAA